MAHPWRRLDRALDLAICLAAALCVLMPTAAWVRGLSGIVLSLVFIRAALAWLPDRRSP